MALKNSKNKKGLFMTILVLILFFLILGELFSFALLTMSYNNLDQSSALGSSSLNYGKSLQASTALFANASLQRAVYTLANYELNATMRKGNFVANTTQYLTYLIVNGTLPSVAANSIPANYLARSMGNLTLKSYNSSIVSLLGTSSISIKVNQTRPLIFQSSPYTLSVSYVEYATLNSTSGKFVYPIAVNVTVSLAGVPDLYYYQQGIARNIRFASPANLTSLIGATNATNGNYLGSAYGPVYIVPTGASGLTCASLSAMVSANVPSFSFAPYNQILILATSNAIGITTGTSGTQCANQYGGLITYSINSISFPPAIPWLAYPSSSGLINSLLTGQQVLILGNTLSTYNIQNLINAAGNGYYFASPFVPSYLDKAQGTVTKQNPNGVFTLSNYNTQASNYNGGNYISIPNSNAINLGSNSFSVSAWIRTGSVNGGYLSKGSGVSSVGWYIFIWGTGGVEAGFYDGVSGTRTFCQTTQVITDNSWHMVTPVWAWNSISSKISLSNIYIDGQPKSCTLNGLATQGSLANTYPLDIGTLQTGIGVTPAQFFTGSIANVQLYNQSLTSFQIGSMYQEGINGVPLPNSGLVGWFPLNGNSNDYSGQNNNGIPTNIIYTLPANYVKDSILSTTVPTSLSPIPGLLNCNSNAQCSNPLLAHTYLGYNPLGIQQNFLQVASFNGLTQNSYINVADPNSALNIVSTLSISAWIYPTSAAGLNNGNIYQQASCNGQYMLFLEGSYVKFRLNNGGISDLSYPINGLNNWYHIVAVWDGSNRYIYINGTLVAQGAYSGTLQSHPNGVGSIGELATGCPNYDFIGQISNVQVYNAPLSANQVKQLYQGGIQGLPVSKINSLAGWWPLNGNPTDYSGNGGNGTIVNVNFPYFVGAYNAPGLSSVTTAANEWQTIGIPRSGG